MGKILWLTFLGHPVVTLGRVHVSIKFVVSTSFLIRENRKHEMDGRTDAGGATLNASSQSSPTLLQRGGLFDVC